MDNPNELLKELIKVPILFGLLAFFYGMYKVMLKHIESTHDKFMSLIKELKNKKDLEN